ncbi:DNA repair protein radC-like protein [Pusillimonas sp. T7-7]|nr:DNA repair protein radC-like protein [Pusillimonas sp. T7-7]
MSHGTLTQASVYPREIVKTALRLDAAAIIMSHNHPSGIPKPSEADLALTRHLKHALTLVDVRLLDHIIVTGQNTTSLAERGQV